MEETSTRAAALGGGRLLQRHQVGVFCGAAGPLAARHHQPSPAAAGALLVVAINLFLPSWASHLTARTCAPARVCTGTRPNRSGLGHRTACGASTASATALATSMRSELSFWLSLSGRRSPSDREARAPTCATRQGLSDEPTHALRGPQQRSKENVLCTPV